MFYLIHRLTSSELLKRQLAPLLAAFVIAELFYKFHSFTLECGAFLVTWYLFGAAWELVGSAGRSGLARPGRRD